MVTATSQESKCNQVICLENIRLISINMYRSNVSFLCCLFQFVVIDIDFFFRLANMVIITINMPIDTSVNVKALQG